jgi:hypothetical protein
MFLQNISSYKSHMANIPENGILILQVLSTYYTETSQDSWNAQLQKNFLG